MTQYAAIVGTQRSGTTVLRSVLGTHPEITSYGEVFLDRHEKMVECFYHFLKHQWPCPKQEDLPGLFRAYLNYLGQMADTPRVVFDCKYQFFRDELIPNGFETPTAPLHLHLLEEGVKVIHLVRRNVLSTYVSGLLSGRTRVWATPHPEEIPDRTVEVPVEDLVKNLQGRQNEIDGFSRMIEGHDYITLFYEDLFQGGRVPPAVLDLVSHHLEVENLFDPVPVYQKIGLPLSQAIRNYDAVCKALQNTPFATYLDG